MAQTFNINPRQQAPAGPGAGFKWLVRICGLIAIGGFFLPFLIKLSGLDMVNNFQEGIGKMGFMDFLKGFFSAASFPGSIVKVLIIFAYIMFPLIGLFMLLRGKYAGGPFTFLLLFTIAAFVMFRFFGDDAGVDTNFFMITGVGYWVSVGGLFLPFLGMFFFDKSI